MYERFRKAGSKNRQFLIGFSNPGAAGVNYCNNEDCKNDSFQVQDGTISKRKENLLFKFYKTGSGIILGSLTTIETPSNFTCLVDKEEEFSVQLET